MSSVTGDDPFGACNSSHCSVVVLNALMPVLPPLPAPMPTLPCLTQTHTDATACGRLACASKPCTSPPPSAPVLTYIMFGALPTKAEGRSEVSVVVGALCHTLQFAAALLAPFTPSKRVCEPFCPVT